jgi:hypothetical protein
MGQLGEPPAAPPGGSPAALLLRAAHPTAPITIVAAFITKQSRKAALRFTSWSIRKVGEDTC